MLLAAALALSPSPETRAQNADPRLLSLSCAGCHGPSGHSPGTIPSLYGRTAGSIADTMRAFRADRLPSTVMGRIAKGYNDAEIDALAQEIAASWK